MKMNDKDAVSDAIHEADSASAETCSLELVDDTHWRCFCGQVNHVMDEFCTACSEPRPNEFSPHVSDENKEIAGIVDNSDSVNNQDSTSTIIEYNGGDDSPPVPIIESTEGKCTINSPNTESTISSRNRQCNETNDTESKIKKYRMIAVAGVCLAASAVAFAMLSAGNGTDNALVGQPNTIASSNDSKRTTESTSSEKNRPVDQKISVDAKSSNNRNANQEASNKPATSNSAPAVVPTGKNWISDAKGVYLWNPEPTAGETISWSGGYVTDGNYKFADGKGVVTWYRDGKIIQVDEGGFSHGRHHGKFVHKFPSGNVMYSNWDHGRELD